MIVSGAGQGCIGVVEVRVLLGQLRSLSVLALKFLCCENKLLVPVHYDNDNAWAAERGSRPLRSSVFQISICRISRVSAWCWVSRKQEGAPISTQPVPKTLHLTMISTYSRPSRDTIARTLRLRLRCPAILLH